MRIAAGCSTRCWMQHSLLRACARAFLLERRLTGWRRRRCGRALEVKLLSIQLVADAPAADSLQFHTALPIPEGYLSDGMKLAVDIGGVTETFTLDSSGRARSDRGSVKLTAERNESMLARVKLALSGELAAALSGENLSLDANVKNERREALVGVLFNGSVYRKMQPLRFTAKIGQGGRAISLPE